MIKSALNTKTIGMLLQQKSIRIALVLNLILLVICVTLVSVSYSYGKKIDGNKTQILEIQAQLDALQKAASDPGTQADDEKIIDRALAPYDQIIPFISFLESLFGIIDKESKITIKNEENQIMINRYADYEVRLKPGAKMDLFLKALDGLYKSKYLTKITSLELDYSLAKDSSISKIEDINLVVRLYFE